MLLVALALVALPAAAEEPKPAAARAPRIAVEPASFDFGKALQEKVLSKEFSIRNFGNEDLAIESITTNCGCTAALLDVRQRVVKPGGSAPLRVEVQTRSSVGKLAKSVLIKSNDPVKPTFELKLEASVVAAK
jgi:hypothetical protein